MKKTFILSLTIALAIAACHRKTVPVIAERKEFPPAPKSAEQSPPANTSELISAGKVLYQDKCNRCHDLQGPEVYTSERWNSILKIMMPRARMNEEEKKQVTAYIMTYARK
ncbi:MAG: hypothetical protein JNK14_18755 [Chitinophagaceae bacterium]|nr:hypothetical protein [Chitinophagaceae bacterium]